VFFQQLAHFVGVFQRFGGAGHDQRHAHQRLAQLGQQRQGDRVFRHAQADGALLRMQQQARHFAGGVENKGVRPRRVSLEQAEGAGVDLGEQAQLGQVAADQREVVLVVQLTQASDTLDRVFVADLTTDGVGRIRWIDHHATGANDLHGLFDQAWLRVFRMNLEELTHVLYLFRRWQ